MKGPAIENEFIAEIEGLVEAQVSKDEGGITWECLIDQLLRIFEGDSVNIEEVEDLLNSYKSNPKDWSKYAKFDKHKYTRNLVHEGNGKFNLMILCWAGGNQSGIHDHANAHCFIKVLHGTLQEIRFEWPENVAMPDGSLIELSRSVAKKDATTYMNDHLGLHRVQNFDLSGKAVSLHIYSPPFGSCQIFDERTGERSTASMTFWSKFGA